MNTSTTALYLDPIDHALPTRPLQQSANVMAAVAITPFVLAAFTTLILVLAVKLTLVLFAAGFER